MDFTQHMTNKNIFARRGCKIAKNTVILDQLSIDSVRLFSCSKLNGLVVYLEKDLSVLAKSELLISPIICDHEVLLFQDKSFKAYKYDTERNEIVPLNVQLERFLVKGVLCNSNLVAIEYTSIRDDVSNRFLSCYSLDLRRIWSIQYPFNSRICFSSTLGDFYYIIDNKCNLICISIKDGTELWRYRETSWPVASKIETNCPLLIYNETLIVSARNVIFGLSVSTGKIIWQLDEESNHACVSDTGTLYFVSYAAPYYLFTVNAVSGNIVSKKLILNLDLIPAHEPAIGVSSRSIYDGAIWLTLGNILTGVDLETAEIFYAQEFEDYIDSEITFYKERCYLTTTSTDVTQFRRDAYILESGSTKS